MADVKVASFEEMEPIYDGMARRARATLGVTSFGMQVMTLPGNWDGYPNHRHDASVEDAYQEEVYIPLEGSGTLAADDQRVTLRPGMMVRVGAEQQRQILPGPDGVRFIALGGVPGSFVPSPWTELGGPRRSRPRSRRWPPTRPRTSMTRASSPQRAAATSAPSSS